MTHPVLSCQQIRQIDQLAIQRLGIPGVVLMENAGRGAVDVMCETGIDGLVVICCGKGNNAGDGYVIARHLELRGFDVQVVNWFEADQLQGDALINHQILLNSSISVSLATPRRISEFFDQCSGADWIVDALLGTGARGEPRTPLAEAIDAMNLVACKKLAIDVPSGLSADNGEAASATFRADHTVTFVAAKQGLVTDFAQPYVGQLHVKDIGVPRSLLAEFGL